MNFTKRNFFTRSRNIFLLCALIGPAAFAFPARAADVTLYSRTTTRSFANAPVLLMPSAVSNATVNAYTWQSNMVPVIHGKGMGLSFKATQGSNSQAANVTMYFGLVYNKTNTSTFTNFSWIVAAPAQTTEFRAFTNLPAAVVDNADGVFWFSTQTLLTNSLTNVVISGTVPN